jgi:hypothetical protein
MAKLVLIAFLLAVELAQAKSLKLDLYATTDLPPKASLGKEPVGGLSGLAWDGQKLFAVSDDRGKFGPPRFYELDLKITAGKAELKPVKMIPVKGTDKEWILDLEAIVLLPGGDFLLSTEGDNNAKPRAMPHIFKISAGGDYKSELPLPEKFLPNPLGLQTKGIENNRGFESVTAANDGQDVYILNEAPIMGDEATKDGDGFWLRLVHFSKDKENFKVAGEYAYLLEARGQTERGVEVFRGASEILHWTENKFLVLERGARLGTKGLAYSGALYLADFQDAKDISKVANLSETKGSAAKKEKLVDLESLLPAPLENFEGLAWGPKLPDGRKSLLVISDNNFSKREKTQLLVFAVKEVD